MANPDYSAIQRRFKPDLTYMPAGSKKTKAVVTSWATERLSDFAQNAEIDGEPDGVGNNVQADTDFSVGKPADMSAPFKDTTPSKVRAIFRAKQTAPTDDVLYLRYKVPFTNYCRKSDGTQIGEFSNGFDGWTENDSAANILINQSDGFLSPSCLRIEIVSGDGVNDVNLKQTDAFTTPSSVAGGKLKLRVLTFQTIFGIIGDISIYVEFSSDDFATTRLTCKILERIGATTNFNFGAGVWTAAASEVTYTLDAVDASSTGSSLLANTAYRIRIRAEKTGGTHEITRDVDYIRVEFPAGETEIRNSDEDEFATFHDYTTLDIRDASAPAIGANFSDALFDVKDIHDTAVTGAGSANTSFSSNNIWDEGWAADGSNNPTGWVTIPSPDTADRIVEVLGSGANAGFLRLKNNHHAAIPPENTIAEAKKTIAHYTSKGITFEFHYRFEVFSAGEGVGGRGGFNLFLSDGTNILALVIRNNKIRYNSGAANAVDFLDDIGSQISSTVGTDYILRGVLIYSGSGSGMLTLWRRVEGTNSWVRLGGVNNATGGTLDPDGHTSLLVQHDGEATDDVEVICKYLSIARGRIPPIDTVPLWSDLKRARFAPYWEIVSVQDGNTFQLDAAGVEVTW